MNYEDKSQVEIERMLDEKYGDDWELSDLDPNDELVKEMWKRIENGKD